MQSSSRLIRCAAFTLLVFLPVPASHASVAHVSFAPPVPTQEDAITVQIDGGFPDLCWSVVDTGCDESAGGVIRIHVHAVDSWVPPAMCQDEPVSYDFTCVVGRLPAGSYTLEVVEELETLRAATPGRVTLPLSVVPVVSTERPTWGRIKVLAREP